MQEDGDAGSCLKADRRVRPGLQPSATSHTTEPGQPSWRRRLPSSCHFLPATAQLPKCFSCKAAARSTRENPRLSYRETTDAPKCDLQGPVPPQPDLMTCLIACLVSLM